ncbi:hypothetical protein EJ08DRAFT_656033 [Tothia fuscella]|uniref:Developmental regulatory protein wetA n=1 Tax=Tothia fuscella TaxID=1048955 RepID=A0A9P4P2D6_9PEZI|nr:hypothetical protein EJ08DRAFT_656033 [Tothia fuscella]
MAVNVSTRQSNKEFQWQQDPVDDLFESFINPDSFHLANGNVERNYSDDLINFFDVQASSSGSDTLDISPLPDLDAARIELNHEDAWHAALSFVRDSAASPVLLDNSRQSSIYSQACGRSAASDSDLLRLHRPGTPIPPLELSSESASAPPGWSLKEKKPFFSTPLVVRKKPKTPHPGIQKATRRGSVSPKMMSSQSHKLSPRQSESWARHLQAAVTEHVDFKIPFQNETPASPPPSTQLKTGGFNYHFGDTQTLRSPIGFHNVTEALSPLSNNEFNFFQPLNTPIGSPTFDGRLASPKTSLAEPQPAHIRSLPPTSFTGNQELANYIMTPPLSNPMASAQWTHDSISSPTFSPADKAEQWWEPSLQHIDPSNVTCGAPVADMLGLGISGVNGPNLSSVTRNGGGIIQSSAVSLGAAPELASSPTPSTFSSQQTAFSASASPIPAATASLYPLSPSQNHAQNMHHQQPSTYRHRQRQHTMSSLSISPLVISQSSHPRTPSVSPPPSARSPTHRRTKSSNHTRRKSGVLSPNNGNGSRHASVGFVNFTPDDSRKILGGVAPSGSSKTKARREKEAADKRRKLSEAAKKAVLDAGGDLGALEREGLLVLGSEL